MERGLIRKRWQVTIPKGVRRELNLFIGQTLNFAIDEEFCIRIATGTMPSAGEAEFYQHLKGKKVVFDRLKKFRKSDGQRAGKPGALKSDWTRKIEKMASFFPTDPEVKIAVAQAAEAEEARQELKQIVSGLSKFLRRLQERI